MKNNLLIAAVVLIIILSCITISCNKKGSDGVPNTYMSSSINSDGDANPINDTQAVPSEKDLQLLDAVTDDDLEAAAALIEEGANVNFMNSDTEKPSIMIAKSLEMLDLLLQSGADIDILDSKGNTVLMIFAAQGELEIVKYLVEMWDAKTFVENSDGEDALSFAIQNGHEEVADYLEQMQ